MNQTNTLEPQTVPNFSIVPENDQSVNPISLTQSGIETSETAKSQSKIWTGRVSLDQQKYQNKPTDGWRISNSIADGITNIDENALIEAIISGKSWSPTIFDGKRDGKHFVEMHALVTDFDSGFEHLDEILQRAEEHHLKFSFIHESFSHTPERPKYRGVFLLDVPIRDYKEAKSYCEWIKDVFKDMVDKSAAEPTRFYYGGRKESLVFHNEGQILSLNSLEEKVADFKNRTEKTKKTPKKNPAHSLQESPKKVNTKIDTAKNGAIFDENDSIYDAGINENGLLIVNDIENHQFIVFDSDDLVDILSLEDLVRVLEIKTALEVLDIEICAYYDTWIKIGMGLHHECTTNDNSDFTDAMRGLFHAWSQKVPNEYKEYETDYKWESFSNRGDDNSIKINTLFYHAHEKVPNVINLARKIYPLVDSYCKHQELEKQKQQLETTLNTDVFSKDESSNQDISFQDKKININTRMFAYIESELRPKMRYNLHTGRFEIDDKELKNVDFIKHLSNVLNHSVSQQLFALVHEKYSEETAYHPFEDYLRQLWNEEIKPSPEEIQWAHDKMQSLVTDIMKVKNDEFAIIIIRKWLVAMVSRVLTPGIKFDHVLTLVGAKGLRKTSFFENIASAQYFTSHTGCLNNKDTLMKFHKRIIIELGEIEAVFRKTDIAVMKDFVTAREDLFRVPYASQMSSYLRRFVLGASANSSNFLKEADGNRRFWIVNITQKMDIEALETQRENILRAALILRATGEKIYLSDEEHEISNQRNMDYVNVPLLEEIEQVLYTTKNDDKKQIISRPFQTCEVERLLRIHYEHKNISNQNVCNALKFLGFTQKRLRMDGGGMKRYWVKEEAKK